MDTPMLQVKNLCTSFNVDAGEVRAVNGISFNLDKGKVLGIVGESGSGKSVTAYSIMRILVEPGKIVGGEILFNGEDIVKYSKKQMREFRGKRVSIIFQDPMTSLNPTFTIGNQLREALGLRSACFTVGYAEGTFTFTVHGYGHGVGMSQYGADYMARQGADYEEILKAYYTGVEIV